MPVVKPKLFITGATGFIGANLVRHFLNQNYPIHILLRRQSDTWRLKGILSRIHQHPIDLTQAKELKQLLKQISPQVIIHTAVANVYRQHKTSDQSLVNTNLLGTINLIKAVNQIDYQAFIQTGSSSEYGPKTKPMKETDACQPQSLYAITKLAATQYARITATQAKKPLITLRLFSPYGPLDDSRRLAPYAVNQAINNHPLKLASPQAVRDYIYIADVIKAYEQAIKYAGKYPGEIFNIGSGKETSVKQVVDTVIKMTRSKSAVEWDKVQASGQDNLRWQANIAKAKKLLRWQPKFNLKKGIGETIAFKTQHESHSIKSAIIKRKSGTSSNVLTKKI